MLAANKMRILITLLFVITIQASFACNCDSDGTIKSNVKSADVVLKVQIIELRISKNLDSIDITFEGDTAKSNFKPWNYPVKVYKAIVMKSYKGQMATDTINIITGINGAACGVSLQENETYLLYGTFDDYMNGFSDVRRYSVNKESIWTNNCTRTWKFSETEEKEVINEIENQQLITPKKH